MWLPVALLVVAAAAAASHESSISETQLVKNLRRQLMRDNSDYSNELPKNTEIHRRADSELDKTLENITTNYYVTRKIYQPGAKKEHHDSETEDVVEGNEYKTKPEIPVSEKDLLYYVDYEKLVSPKPEDRKYKTLKVGQQFRRSGRSQYIQEEGTEGVAILSLHRAPFPELRLPRARRQYRHPRARPRRQPRGGASPAAGRRQRPTGRARRRGGRLCSVIGAACGSTTRRNSTMPCVFSTTMQSGCFRITNNWLKMGLPGYCSASGVFADADCFYTPPGADGAQPWCAVRASCDGIVRAFADRFDCQYLNHWHMVHVVISQACLRYSFRIRLFLRLKTT